MARQKKGSKENQFNSLNNNKNSSIIINPSLPSNKKQKSTIKPRSQQ